MTIIKSDKSIWKIKMAVMASPKRILFRNKFKKELKLNCRKNLGTNSMGLLNV